MPTAFKMKRYGYDYLTEHPKTDALGLRQGLADQGISISKRTSRRWVQHFNEGIAVPEDVNVRVTSSAMQEWVDDETESFDVDTFFEEATRLVEQKQKQDPVLTKDEFTFDVDHPIAVMFVSCMHLGGAYTRYETFREVFNRALTIKHLYWGSLGDDIEGFPEWFRDVEAVRKQLTNVDNQIEILRSILFQLNEGNQLLFGCNSQHGGKWELKSTGKNSVKDLYWKEMRVPFYDGQAYLRLNVGGMTYHVAVAHEFPGSSITNPNHPQKRALWQRYPMADVIVMGDKHNPAYQWHKTYPDEVEMGNRASSDIHLLQAGTLKTGPDKYTIQNYAKGMFGWPILIFHPDQHRIEVTFHLDRVEQFLTKF